MNTNRAVKAVAVIIGMMVVIFGAALTQASASKGPHHDTALCEVEDGSTQKVCFWDAERQGNGKGKSFYSFNYGEDVVYVK